MEDGSLNIKILTVILVCFLFISLPVYSQTSDKVLFDQGLQLYKNKNFEAAQNTFLKILKNYPNSRLITVTKLMLAKSYYMQKDYHSAFIVCDNFLQVHKNSSYVDDIHFLRGKIYFRQNQYMQAVEEWLNVIYGDGDLRLKRQAGNFVFHTMLNYLNNKELTALQKKYNDEPLRGLITIVHAQHLIQEGNEREGYRKLQLFLEKSPYHLYGDIARRILEGSSGANVAGNTILILKSRQQEMKDIAEAITKGVYYAAYEMSIREPQKNISVDSIAIEGGVLSAAQVTLTALKKKTPLVVVGALGNEETAALALLSRYEHFPFVSPLSSQTGLAAISPYTFQINPDAEIKGRVLAEYAINELGAKTFAILAPADLYGQRISSSFEETILENGGEIVEKQWYYENTQDFSRQLKAIRKKGFYITFRDSVKAADSTLTEEEIKNKFKEYLTEVLFSDENTRGKIDSTQVPSTGIDAVFMAIYPSDIPYIAPQFAFYNIQTKLLGNEGWNDPVQLKQNQIYLDGLIYITSGYIDFESWNYKEFQSRFRQKMHTTPTLYHLLGYDIGKWMISGYQPGMTRQDFCDKLENSPRFQGIMERIHFGDKPRVNSELNIIHFYLGEFIKVR